MLLYSYYITCFLNDEGELTTTSFEGGNMKALQQKRVQIICIIVLACALVTPVLAQTTSLTISVSPLNPVAGDAFTVSGFLRDNVTEEGLTGQFVTVELSTNGGASFVPVASLVTITDGAFEVDQTQTFTGTYLYRATFAGTSQIGPSVSNRVNVTVGAAPGPAATALTIGASPSNPAVGDEFTVSGIPDGRDNRRGSCGPVCGCGSISKWRFELHPGSEPGDGN